MKIVQFKDGRYGIRKFSVFGYVFLGRDTSENYWWTMKEYIPKHAAMTKEEVIDRWKQFSPKREWFDNGRVVKLSELEQ